MKSLFCFRLPATAFLATLVACSTQAPSEPDSPAYQGVRTQALGAATGSVGYQHTMAASKFWMGAMVDQISLPMGTRYVGSEGAALAATNGAFSALPNADAPIRLRGPLTSSGAVHNQRVRDYFVASGLPVDQIGGVQENAIMDAEGSSASQLPTTQRFRGLVSVLSRRLGGTRVEGSYAWAQFSSDDSVVAESVWWPAVPQQVLSDLARFQALLADPKASAAFRAALPKAVQLEKGELVIHHSPAVTFAWKVGVTINFSDPKRKAVLRFAMDASPVTYDADVPGPQPGTADLSPNQSK
jgi:hypothetical protein